MHQPAIARLEAGDHEPSLTTLARLARGLGVEFHIDVTPETLELRETACSPRSFARVSKRAAAKDPDREFVALVRWADDDG
jgi:transcriptional regulator with XRE-family HTH domain